MRRLWMKPSEFCALHLFISSSFVSLPLITLNPSPISNQIRAAHGQPRGSSERSSMMRVALSVSSCHRTPLLQDHPERPVPDWSPQENNNHHHCCCCLLLQHCTDATRSGPAIFMLDSCTENLNCYEEKHTLMIFFFSRLYTIVLMR